MVLCNTQTVRTQIFLLWTMSIWSDSLGCRTKRTIHQVTEPKEIFNKTNAQSFVLFKFPQNLGQGFKYSGSMNLARRWQKAKRYEMHNNTLKDRGKALVTLGQYCKGKQKSLSNIIQRHLGITRSGLSKGQKKTSDIHESQRIHQGQVHSKLVMKE